MLRSAIDYINCLRDLLKDINSGSVDEIFYNECALNMPRTKRKRRKNVKEKNHNLDDKKWKNYDEVQLKALYANNKSEEEEGRFSKQGENTIFSEGPIDMSSKSEHALDLNYETDEKYLVNEVRLNFMLVDTCFTDNIEMTQFSQTFRDVK